MDGHRRRHIGGVASSIENLREAEGLNAPLKSETRNRLMAIVKTSRPVMCGFLCGLNGAWFWGPRLWRSHGGRRVYRCTVPVLASSARDRSRLSLSRLAVDSCSRHVTPPITRIVFMRPNRTPHWVLRRSQPHPKGGHPTRAQPQPKTECAAARALRGGSPGGRGA